MQIGSFGDVIFRVEEENILTIKAMSREKKSRWEEAQILNDLSFLEFRGRDLTTVSLDIQLIETSKMKIVDTLNTLNNMLENGENHELILGNTLIGEFPFVLESMSEKLRTSWNPRPTSPSPRLLDYFWQHRRSTQWCHGTNWTMRPYRTADKHRRRPK